MLGGTHHGCPYYLAALGGRLGWSIIMTLCIRCRSKCMLYNSMLDTHAHLRLPWIAVRSGTFDC